LTNINLLFGKLILKISRRQYSGHSRRQHAGDAQALLPDRAATRTALFEQFADDVLRRELTEIPGHQKKR
jgi:hypothetical protein